MYFLRHANTEGDVKKVLEARNWEADVARSLTPKGIRQAIARRKQLGNLAFDLCIVSPAKRCWQTAQLLIGDSPNVVLVIEEVPTLYPISKGEVGKLMWDAFEELLYAPLDVYLQSKAGEAIAENGRVNAEAIKRVISNCPYKPQRILIVDHAVTLQAAGQHFTTDQRLFSQKVGEVEGFMIDTASQKATIIKDPELVS